jgi:stage V sporulation protein AE
MGTFLTAFIVGGLICVVGQLLMDLTKLTPAHILCTFVVCGAILSGFGLYKPFIEFAGAGATVPIVSFGNSLVEGVLEEVKKDGFIGVLSGIFNVTSAGISAAIIFGFLTSLLFRPKG